MNKFNLILYRTVMILLCLVLITLSMVSGRFARYSTGDASVSMADIAAFNVSVTAGIVEDNELTKVYPITVTNRSEVDVGFSKITVQLDEALPEDVTLVLIDEEGNALCDEQETDGTQTEFIFTAAHTLASQQAVTFSLQITQASGAVFDAGEYTMKVTLQLYQID